MKILFLKNTNDTLFDGNDNTFFYFSGWRQKRVSIWIACLLQKG